MREIKGTIDKETLMHCHVYKMDDEKQKRERKKILHLHRILGILLLLGIIFFANADYSGKYSGIVLFVPMILYSVIVLMYLFSFSKVHDVKRNVLCGVELIIIENESGSWCGDNYTCTFVAKDTTTGYVKRYLLQSQEDEKDMKPGEIVTMTGYVKKKDMQNGLKISETCEKCEQKVK